MYESKHFFGLHTANAFAKLSFSLLMMGLISALIIFFKPEFLSFKNLFAPIIGIIAFMNLLGLLSIFLYIDYFKNSAISKSYYIFSFILNGIGLGIFAEGLSLGEIPATFLILSLQSTLFAFYIKKKKIKSFDKRGLLALMIAGAIIAFWYAFIVYNFDFKIMITSAILPIILLIQRENIKQEYIAHSNSDDELKNYEYSIANNIMSIAFSFKLLGQKLHKKKKLKNKK